MLRGVSRLGMVALYLWSATALSDQQAVNLVSVPAGNLELFWLSPTGLGPKSGEKNRMLKVPGFQAMKRPVTVGEFRRFLRDHPKWMRDAVPRIFADESYLSDFNDKLKDQIPVTQVSWFVARAFCNSRGMRLPTQNEWEYMAAASETERDANRDEKFLRRILDWYGEPRGTGLKPVGSIYQNIYGLWDLHGLIWEWVEDFNSSFVTGESREDSSFNKNMFCGSGGMAGADKENYAAFMRFAFRSGLKGNSTVWNLGFRCVK